MIVEKKLKYLRKKTNIIFCHLPNRLILKAEMVEKQEWKQKQV